jgi:hypothetical protein
LVGRGTIRSRTVAVLGDIARGVAILVGVGAIPEGVRGDEENQEGEGGREKGERGRRRLG